MKGRMDKGLFGYKFMTIEVKHTSKNKVYLQNGDVPIDPPI
jgi:Holliday junction resolvase